MWIVWCDGELCFEICKCLLINPHYDDVPPRHSPGPLSPSSDQLMLIVYGTNPLLSSLKLIINEFKTDSP